MAAVETIHQKDSFVKGSRRGGENCIVGLSPPVGHAVLTGEKDGWGEEEEEEWGESWGCRARALEVGKAGAEGGVGVGSCSPACSHTLVT